MEESKTMEEMYGKEKKREDGIRKSVRRWRIKGIGEEKI